MGQLLHACARTTEKVRRDIQNSEESLIKLSKRYGINPKTVAKWRSRKGEGVADRKMGSKSARSVLSAAEEAVICEFRRQTRLPLDDCYDCLKDQIPKLSRSNLHRGLQRHGLSNLNALQKQEQTEAAPKKTFKDYPIGFVHVDIAELHVGKQKLYLFVGIPACSRQAPGVKIRLCRTLQAHEHRPCPGVFGTSCQSLPF